MSTEREATPPARIWIDWRERDAQRGVGSYYFNGREGFSTEYIRADSFDTMRDALVEIAQNAQPNSYMKFVAERALAVVESEKCHAKS